MKTSAETGYPVRNYPGTPQNIAPRRKKGTSKHPLVIGVVIPEMHSYFMQSIVAGIESVAGQYGADIIITHSHESVAQEISNAGNLFNRQVDGMIASLAPDTKDLKHYTCFMKKNIPVIFVDRVDEQTEWTHIIIDNFRSGYIATKHLLDQGCRRIAIITGNQQTNVYANRLAGFREAIREAGVHPGNSLVMINDLSNKSISEAADELAKWRRKKPGSIDGLFVTNDFGAAICIRSFQAQGIDVPGDIAVVGFNNDTIGTMIKPSLTTIDYPGWDMGVIAAQKLMEHVTGLHDLSYTRRVVLKTSLVVRDSSMRRPC